MLEVSVGRQHRGLGNARDQCKRRQWPGLPLLGDRLEEVTRPRTHYGSSPTRFADEFNTNVRERGVQGGSTIFVLFFFISATRRRELLFSEMRSI